MEVPAVPSPGPGSPSLAYDWCGTTESYCGPPTGNICIVGGIIRSRDTESAEYKKSVRTRNPCAKTHALGLIFILPFTIAGWPNATEITYDCDLSSTEWSFEG